jgi:adenosine deaminase
MATAPLLCPAQVPVPHGQRFALIIGVARYPNYPKDKQLSYSDSDAEEFASFVQTNGGGRFSPNNIKLLVNENATHSRIMEAVTWLGRRVTGDDVVYIFFAGHGETDGLGHAYFMPYNADPSLPDDLGLRADRFLDDLKTKISAKYMIFFVDACHAGAALSQGTGSSRASDQNIIPNILGLWQKRLSDLDAINMGIFSASSNQLSWEDQELQHGLFTYFLIKGMQGAADLNCDGAITAQELFEYTMTNVEQRSKQRFAEQTPIVSSSWEPRFPLAIYSPQPSVKQSCVPVSAEPVKSLRNGLVRSSSFREAHAAYQFESVRNDPVRVVQFLRGMPKGGDLHVHLSGAVYAESWIRAGAEDGLCVNTAELSFVRPQQAGNGDEAKAVCNGVNVPVAQAYQDQHLYDGLVDAFSMRGYVASNGSTGHDHFFDTFSRFGGTDKRHLGEWIDEIASRAASENDQYLELMYTSDFSHSAKVAHEVGWQSDFHKLREELLSRGMKDDVSIASASIDKAEPLRRKMEKCGEKAELPACSVEIRYLYQILRGFPKEVVFAQTLLGFEIASKDHRFVGVNFVMPEDGATSMSDYTLHMQIIDFMHSVYPNVHISLHAGELASGLVPPDGMQFHIRDAVERGHAERIGHGTDIAYEDNSAELLRELAAKNVLVEICLTSDDVVLGIRGNDHPLQLYLQNGVPVALATNDPGVLRIDLSREFIRAAQTHKLRYDELKLMARQSLEHSFLHGVSLWTDVANASIAGPCAADLPNALEPTARCKELLALSEKAQQEWALEQRFFRFESQF